MHNQAFVQKLSQDMKLQGEDLMVRCADGSHLELSISRSVELDAEGNAIVISIAQDNSHRKALKVNMQKLLDSEKRFSYVVKNVPIPIIIIDKKGDIIEANPEAVEASGYPLAHIKGRNFIDLIVAKESQKKAPIAAGRAMQGEDFRAIEPNLQNAKGDQYEYECSLGFILHDTGLGEGQLVAIARNISNQKALELSLTKAREAAESADLIKSMFVASM